MTNYQTPLLRESLERTALPLQVACRLEDMIASGQLSAGQRLAPERQLAASLGVARPVLREAIQILADRGLLHSRQGSGTSVTDLSPTTLMRSLERGYTFLAVPDSRAKIHELRACIEPGLAALTATRARPEAVDRLDALVATMRRSYKQRAHFLTADRDFHLQLADGAGNELFRILLEPMHAVLAEHMDRVTQRATAAQLRAIADQHEPIVAAIRAGDPVAAHGAMQRHFGDPASV